ncbi:MAG TPA: VOC family protein [Bacteroidota bacterium]|nr:VOC family protein [Bacteroidota bacterium]
MSADQKNGDRSLDGPIDRRTSIGHVHLKVADLERSVRFYTDVLGFEITARMGKSAAFLSAGGYHHHIGLNTWESAGGSPPPQGSTGLYHFAILMPNRKELARTLARLIERKWDVEGASDHGVSESIYLHDPDRNGIEIYADRPRDQWPREPGGELIMYTGPLDVESLMREINL